MQQIVGKHITMTRGDTFKATVTMETASGEIYAPAAGDVIRFAMKKKITDATALITKILDNSRLLLQLDPADTKQLPYGDYLYDIEITYASGEVDTFISKAVLTLAEEVD